MEEIQNINNINKERIVYNKQVNNVSNFKFFWFFFKNLIIFSILIIVFFGIFYSIATIINNYNKTSLLLSYLFSFVFSTIILIYISFRKKILNKEFDKNYLKSKETKDNLINIFIIVSAVLILLPIFIITIAGFSIAVGLVSWWGN